jgi:hypothetical protein
VEALEAKGVMNTGNFNKKRLGSHCRLVLLIGASYDHRFRAYESSTGKLLWETKLAADAGRRVSWIDRSTAGYLGPGEAFSALIW